MVELCVKGGSLKKRRLSGKRYWVLEMKLQKEDVWKLTKKKRERLKAVYIRAKRR